MAKKLRIGIYGSGAIGCLIAARLSQANCDVALIARGETLAAIKSNGVHLLASDTEISSSVFATDEPAEVGPLDYLFITVKQNSLTSIAGKLSPLLRFNPTVVPAINGIPWWFFHSRNTALGDVHLRSVDEGGVMHGLVAPQSILGSVVYIAAHTVAPGVVSQGPRNNLVLGELDGTVSLRSQALQQAFLAAGLDCRISTDIHSDVWLKVAGNAVFNPLSVLALATMQELVDDPYMAGLAHSMLDECLELGRSLELSLTVTAKERFAIARTAGPVQTSMLQDSLKGRPLEVNALIGSMVEIGERMGSNMPFTKAIFGLIQSRNKAGFSVQD